MVGISDKLLLFFIAFRHRTYYPLGDDDGQSQDQYGTSKQDKKYREQHKVCCILVHGPVDEYQNCPIFRRGNFIAVF